MIFERSILARRLNLVLGSLLLATASTASLAQQYVFAPTSFGGADGWVVGWMSNKPASTINQDWYLGSSAPAGVGPATSDTHDTTFLSMTGPQRVGSGMTMSADPLPAFADYQIVSGLSATNISAATAIAQGQYIEFPFRTGTMLYADAQPSAAQFYVNGIVTAKRWNLNGNVHPREYGYAAYIVDGSANHVVGPIQVIPRVSDIPGSTPDDFQFVRPPDGPGPGITLQPGTDYALRFYLFRTPANTDGRASWDDTMFTMSRQALAEIIVTASTVSATPAGSQNNYSYTFDVYNNGPDATTASISDPLPGTANGGSATWTCVLQSPAAPCATPSGTGAVSTTEPLISGQTAVYTVSWTGPGVTTSDTHNVTAQPTSGSPPDPISTNNSAPVSLAPPTISAENDSLLLTSSTSPGSTTVTTNDSGVGGTVDPNSVEVQTPPSVGSVACVAGVCTYTPPSGGLTAPVDYVYTVCLAAPNQTICTTATVTVTPPPAVVARDDSVTLLSNTSPGVIDVTTNDTGIMGTVNPASVAVTSPPAVGSVTCSAGVCTYTPPAGGLTTVVTYQYNICLAAPNEAVCTTATVTVLPPTHVPVPVMGWWGLSSLASLLGLAGMRRIRRRQ
ncbi:MAG: hypothetical protein I8H77_07525 [Comamonadaceae bacterium]|nr:hypothetical protein [Comamonadaceae bacterium]